MRSFKYLLTRLKAAFRSENVHEEISEELQFHIEMKAADLMRSGFSANEARTAAARSFGSAFRIQEQGYDVRGGGLPEQLWGDLRFAFRLLRKQWLKTSVLVATIALGIGVNSAVFGVVRSVLLQPLPFRNPGELVILHQADHAQFGGVSYPHFLDWRTASRSFQSMAVYSATSATLTGQGDAAIVFGAIASASLFRVLDVHPVRGRLFRDDEDRFSSGSASLDPILITDSLWRSRFGGREDALGRNIHLDGHIYQIVGIIPGGYSFPLQKDRIDYWVTVARDADPSLYGGTIPTSRGYPRYDGVVARLNAGMNLQRAQSEMNLLAQRIARAHPKSTSSNEVLVVPALSEIVGQSSRTMVLILYASALCVLLVACINVANLLLASALGRRREFSMRMALGAPISKIVRQLLVESCVVSIGGGLAGVVLAWFVLRLFIHLAPEDTPRLADIHLDLAVFVYAIAVSLICGVLFGSLPAFSIRRRDLAVFLKEGARGVTRRASILQPNSLLIFGQVVIGMILTCCAGLLLTSLRETFHMGRGFDPHGVWTTSISLPVAQYQQRSSRVLAYYRTLLRDIASLPGVQRATISEVLPLSGQSNSTSLKVVGSSIAGSPSANLRFVEPNYFDTLQISLRTGRIFNSRDTGQQSPCAIVNEAFVRGFLPDKDPLASSLLLGWGGDEPKQIVGVVRDIRGAATSRSSEPEVYVPFAQFPLNSMSLLIRTTGDPDALTEPVRAIARRIDPSVPLDRVRTLEDYLRFSSAQQQLLTWLLIAFAATAVFLSAVGLYGVISDQVSSRINEFGIRLAIGSSRSRVMTMVLAQGLRVTVVAICVGSLSAVFVARSLQRWLYDGGADHLGPFLLSAAILIAVTFAACWVPSRRAAKCDPASLLRSE